MKIVFTDLDGSLLDYETYSFDAAKEALKMIRKSGIPLIICSSKTKGEIEIIRKKLHNTDPFVAENGGAVYFPKWYRHFEYEYTSEEEYYHVLEMGVKRNRLREVFLSVKEDLELHIRSFSDMSLNEIMNLTSLPEREAKFSLDRGYSEPFAIPEKDKDREREIITEFERRGYNVVKGGRFYHLMGLKDKGDAVRILTGIFAANMGERVVSLGLGDSENDLSMLRVVDKPVLVRRWDGGWLDHPEATGYARTQAVGPAGWNDAVLDFLLATNDG